MGIVSELCDELCFMNKYSIKSQYLRTDDIDVDVSWDELSSKCAEELGGEVIAFSLSSFILFTGKLGYFFIVEDEERNYEIFKLKDKEEALKRFNRFSIM
jgi:hypothetical protein